MPLDVSPYLTALRENRLFEFLEVVKEAEIAAAKEAEKVIGADELIPYLALSFEKSGINKQDCKKFVLFMELLGQTVDEQRKDADIELIRKIYSPKGEIACRLGQLYVALVDVLASHEIDDPRSPHYLKKEKPEELTKKHRDEIRNKAKVPLIVAFNKELQNFIENRILTIAEREKYEKAIIEDFFATLDRKIGFFQSIDEDINIPQICLAYAMNHVDDAAIKRRFFRHLLRLKEQPEGFKGVEKRQRNHINPEVEEVFPLEEKAQQYFQHTLTFLLNNRKNFRELNMLLAQEPLRKMVTLVPEENISLKRKLSNYLFSNSDEIIRARWEMKKVNIPPANHDKQKKDFEIRFQKELMAQMKALIIASDWKVKGKSTIEFEGKKHAVPRHIAKIFALCEKAKSAKDEDIANIYREIILIGHKENKLKSRFFSFFRVRSKEAKEVYSALDKAYKNNKGKEKTSLPKAGRSRG